MKEGSRQFEEAMKRLETIVDLLEREEVSLDESLKTYEEGIKLVRFCSKKLQDAEKKIEVLTRDEKGKIVVDSVEEESLNNGKRKQKKDIEEDRLLF